MNDAHSRQFVEKGGAESTAETVTKRNVLRSVLGDGSQEVLSTGEQPRREKTRDRRAEEQGNDRTGAEGTGQEGCEYF